MADYGFDTGVSWPPPPLLPVDGDGDGWEPPEDCDDDDRDVHPDATEVPYNGVDEDCQDGDLVDVDGDGYSAVEAGGDDCADARRDLRKHVSVVAPAREEDHRHLRLAADLGG